MSTKEEQKQHLIDLMNRETLEEAAKELYPINIVVDYDTNEDIRTIWIEGAKWQQEQDKRMYSEEEVRKLLIAFSDDRTFLKKDVAIQWFEQFKKQ